MFTMFDRRGPTKRGRPQARRHVGQQHDIFWHARQGPLNGVCDMHLVQHDNLWSVNIIRLPNSESRISNHVIAAKHAFVQHTLVTLNSW